MSIQLILGCCRETSMISQFLCLSWIRSGLKAMLVLWPFFGMFFFSTYQLIYLPDDGFVQVQLVYVARDCILSVFYFFSLPELHGYDIRDVVFVRQKLDIPHWCPFFFASF